MKLLFVTTILAFGATSAAIAQEPTGNIENGRKHFMQIGCYQCHGTVGQGAAQTGPTLAHTSLPLEGFMHQLRHPLNQMAPYEPAVLSDHDAADIYAFIKSLPAAADPKSLPTLMNMGLK